MTSLASPLSVRLASYLLCITTALLLGPISFQQLTLVRGSSASGERRQLSSSPVFSEAEEGLPPEEDCPEEGVAPPEAVAARPEAIVARQPEEDAAAEGLWPPAERALSDTAGGRGLFSLSFLFRNSGGGNILTAAETGSQEWFTDWMDQVDWMTGVLVKVCPTFLELLEDLEARIRVAWDDDPDHPHHFSVAPREAEGITRIETLPGFLSDQVFEEEETPVRTLLNGNLNRDK